MSQAPVVPSFAAPKAAPRGPAIGAMFLAFFGTCWLVLACLGDRPVSHPWPAIACSAIGTLIFVSAFLLNREQRGRQARLASAPTAEELHEKKVFSRVNLVQWAACAAMVAVLNIIHHPEWIMASIIMIVGLHFFPLAALFRNRMHVILGTLLVAIAVLLPWCVAGGPQSVMLPLATGAVLLAGAALHLHEAYVARHV